MIEGAREGFGLWLKAQRQSLGISRTELADSLGLWPEALWQIESLRHLPSEKLQRLLANELRAIEQTQKGADHVKQ